MNQAQVWKVTLVSDLGVREEHEVSDVFHVYQALQTARGKSTIYILNIKEVHMEQIG